MLWWWLWYFEVIKCSPIKDVVGLSVDFIFLQGWSEIFKFIKNGKLLLNKMF
jgi:hypothetical protein